MIGILSGVVGLVSLVCWIIVLIKMFQDKESGIGKAIFGVICGIYALIWGWQNNEKHKIKTIMLVWTLAVVASIILQVVGSVLA